MPNERYIDASDWRGRHRGFWSYWNQDSSFHVTTCCGQAAVHSAYRTKRDATYRNGLTGLVRDFPPDNFFGLLGTSPGRIEQMVRALNLRGGRGTGLTRLATEIEARPVIVCLDVGKIDPAKWGMHWVTLFGFAGGYAYVSNWRDNRIRFQAFREAWTAPLVWTAGMSETFIKT